MTIETVAKGFELSSVIMKGAEASVIFMSGTGAKILVEEAVKKLTPEDLTYAKQLCVNVAKWGATTSVAAVCAAGIHKKVETGTAICDKMVSILRKEPETEEVEVDAEPVVEVTDESELVEVIEIEEA